MIRIRSSDDFKRLLIALVNDVRTANHHWQLHQDLSHSFKADSTAYSQSPAFWHLTLAAHEQAAVHCLARVYDQDDRALHLVSWLVTIQKNLHLFETHEFRKRLAGNPFVDSLSESSRVPDAAQLAIVIAACSRKDANVKQLLLVRHNFIAHRSARIALGGSAASERMALTYASIQVLMSRAAEVTNRYAYLFEATHYSQRILGQDDYRFVLDCIQERVHRSHKETLDALGASDKGPGTH